MVSQAADIEQWLLQEERLFDLAHMPYEEYLRTCRNAPPHGQEPASDAKSVIDLARSMSTTAPTSGAAASETTTSPFYAVTVTSSFTATAGWQGHNPQHY